MPCAVLAGVMIAVLGPAPGASAESFDDLLTGGASGNCKPRDAADGEITTDTKLPFLLCDDGFPTVGGGATPNPAGEKAIEVPSAYTGFAGLPAKDPTPMVPGEDTESHVALDVDVSLPDPANFGSPPTGDRYPVVVFMHGCCSGQRTDWEANDLDGGGDKEKWHYNNAWFAARGYIVVNYTARGFVRGNNTPVQTDDRGSTGQTQLDHRGFEINDYQHLVGQLVDKGDLHPDGGKTVKVDPDKIVTTGGSYGGGFSWLALTDPEWTSPGAAKTPIRLAATAPRYGWTDLAYSLVPNGTHLEDRLQDFQGDDTKTPLGFPKRSIVAGLYASGRVGLPNSFNHTTFSTEIDTAFACLQSPSPFSAVPQCGALQTQTLPSFIQNRSAYYQNHFFEAVDNGSIDPVPIFSSGTLTDPLFPGREHRRIAERLRSIDASYPIQEYYGDYQHFVQNKRKEWSDLCGADEHVCAFSEFSDLNANPTGFRRRGINALLNRFLDHYVKPPANTTQAEPQRNVTASLQICPENATAQYAVDEPGPRFTEDRFEELAPNVLRVRRNGEQTTTSKALPNTHATEADPVFNLGRTSEVPTEGPEGRCPRHTTPAGAGVATYDSPELERTYTMIGPTRVTVPYSLAGGSATELQLNARLYDVFPDGKQVMVDRGFRTLTGADPTAVFDLLGNGWRFPAGHRIRIELAQDDDPYIKASTAPSSLTLAGVDLRIPVRESSAVIGDAAQTEPPASDDDGGDLGAGDDEPSDASSGDFDVGSGGGGGGDADADDRDGGRLPFTGLGLALLVIAGALFLTLGVTLRSAVASGRAKRT